MQPLRIIFYVSLPPLFSPLFNILSYPSILILGNWSLLLVLIIANVAFVFVAKGEKIRSMSIINTIFWLISISVAILGIEIIALVAHALSGIAQEAKILTFNGKFWTVIATIFTGLGGLVHELSLFYGEKVDKIILSRINKKYVKILFIIFIVVIVILSYTINPLTKSFFRL